MAQEREAPSRMELLEEPPARAPVRPTVIARPGIGSREVLVPIDPMGHRTATLLVTVAILPADNLDVHNVIGSGKGSTWC